MSVVIDHLTYWYPGREVPALKDVKLKLDEGEFSLVAGPSAGGKSTFLRLLNGLVPQFYGGRLAGSVRVAGLDPARTPARRMATIAGLVFQEPEAQAVVDVAEDEIAFGMEQQGVPPPEMRSRLERLLDELAIGHLRSRRIASLSGGERQRVAIAAVLALEPKVLALDEPTSQLDPTGAAQVIEALRATRMRRELTILLAEHRLERLTDAVGGVIRVEEGVVQALSVHDAMSVLPAIPPICELGLTLGISPVPLSVREALLAVAAHGLRVEAAARVVDDSSGRELLRVEGATVKYGDTVALQEVSLTVREGEVVALVGPNGSGKSTLFRLISGLSPAESGTVSLNGLPAPRTVQERTAFAALVPQDPAIALYHDTVRDEVADTIRARRASGTAEEVMARWDAGGLSGRNPRDISVGQQQRVAIAAMVAHEPRVWLLDEPTRGADGPAKAWLLARLRDHVAGGGAAIVATHDIESAARFATRVVGLEAGRVAFDLPVRIALGHGGPMPTQVAQVVPGALTVEDVAVRAASATMGVGR